jgi:hypothetical protein
LSSTMAKVIPRSFLSKPAMYLTLVFLIIAGRSLCNTSRVSTKMIEDDDALHAASTQTFMVESPLAQDPPFELEYDDDAWESSDINDFFAQLILWAPQRCWLELSGDPDGLHFAPFLCVCVHLKIRFEQMQKILGRGWGSSFKNAAAKRGTREGLKRSDVKDQQPVWIWVDRTCQPPPVGFGPGISHRCVYSL